MGPFSCLQIAKDNTTPPKNNVMKKTLTIVLLLISLSGAAQQATLVRESGRIYLKAESIDYDFKRGIIHYRGNVVVCQNSSELSAEDIQLFYNRNHRIEKMVAKGKQALYKTLMQNDKDRLVASASSIIYYPRQDKVMLRGNARVRYGLNTFSGNFILYDIKHQRISSKPDEANRTNIVLEPIKDLKKTFKK